MSFLRILPASITSLWSNEPAVNKLTNLTHLEKTARQNGFIKAADIYNELSGLGYKSTDEVSEVINGLREPVATIDVDSLHDLFTERNMPANLIYKIAGFNYKEVKNVPGLNIFISFDAVQLTSLMLIREREFNAKRQEERYESAYGQGSLNSPINGLDILQFKQKIAPTSPVVEPGIPNTILDKKSAA